MPEMSLTDDALNAYSLMKNAHRISPIKSVMVMGYGFMCNIQAQKFLCQFTATMASKKKRRQANTPLYRWHKHEPKIQKLKNSQHKA